MRVRIYFIDKTWATYDNCVNVETKSTCRGTKTIMVHFNNGTNERYLHKEVAKVELEIIN